ncbi:MAG TPA: hypothetical protein VFB79_22185 [Candidatus Angelobacter sp.]|nr:hypothetical protein [Candidatus Angelobacter sp.]
MKKASILAFLSLSILTGCTGSSSGPTAQKGLDHPQVAKKEWTLTDVKGDVLGMDYDAYSRRHPDECYAAIDKNVCFESNHSTYADIKAEKRAEFFHGQLVSIQYTVNHTYNEKTHSLDDAELLAAMLNKFGAPLVDQPGVKIWRNESVSIFYTNQPSERDPTYLTFTLKSLANERSAEWKKEKDKAATDHAAAAKKDM